MVFGSFLGMCEVEMMVLDSGKSVDNGFGIWCTMWFIGLVILIWCSGWFSLWDISNNWKMMVLAFGIGTIFW